MFRSNMNGGATSEKGLGLALVSAVGEVNPTCVCLGVTELGRVALPLSTYSHTVL
jgi:hypothetical protein